jgi:hypothetical protein
MIDSSKTRGALLEAADSLTALAKGLPDGWTWERVDAVAPEVAAVSRAVAAVAHQLREAQITLPREGR